MKVDRALHPSVAAAALATVLIAAAGAAWAEPLRVPLEWRTAIEVGDLGPIDLAGLEEVLVEVVALEDARPNRHQVGIREVADRSTAVTTSGSVAEFVTERLSHLLEEMGLAVVSRGGALRLEGRVERFSVREGTLYEAEVALGLRLHVPGGEAVWSGTVEGGASRYGPPAQTESYQEALSDALFEAVHRWVTDPDVVRALGREATEQGGR